MFQLDSEPVGGALNGGNGGALGGGIVAAR